MKKKEKQKKIEQKHEGDEMRKMVGFLETLFKGPVYCNILFTYDNRRWQYAIKFQHKLKAIEITKIFKFIFEREEMADYEIRPDMTGDAVWFVFDILQDGVSIGG